MQAVGTQHQQLIYGNSDTSLSPQQNEELSIADNQELLYAESQGVQQASDSNIYQLHGVYPSSKAEGICWIIYENVNGLQSSLTNNNKLMKLCDTIDKLQADIIGITEHRINFRHPDVVNGPKQMFQREAALSAVGGHNIHECVGRVQEGGTLMMAIDEVNENYTASDSDKDPTGLGRWVSMAFKSNSGHTTRVITAYNPCYNNNFNSRTIFQQQRRYFVKQCNDTTSPRKRFHEDLLYQLKLWRANDERLILCMDANSHVYNSALGRDLVDPNGLGMVEPVQSLTGQPIGPTHFRGSNPIDAVWTTADIAVVNVCVLPVGFSVGDHRMFAIDITSQSFLGSDQPAIQRPPHRRLTTRSPRTVNTYNDILTNLLTSHRCLERLHDIYTQTTPSLTPSLLSNLNKLHQEVSNYMSHAEKKCHKIKNGVIPFSPEAAIWLRQRQTYHRLLSRTEGGRGNTGNLVWAAWRCGITHPLSLTTQDIQQRIAICNERCHYFRLHGNHNRSAHLSSWLAAARAKDDNERTTRILEIISREQQRQQFTSLRKATGQPRGRSVSSVQVVRDGIPTELMEEEAVTAAIISEVHNKRYTLANDAPICQAPLFHDFGHMSLGQAASDVLVGTYTNMALDSATANILQEINHIHKHTTPISTTIMPTDWQHYWHKAAKRTSSSPSGLHFGHYKALAHSHYLSHFHAAKTTVALQAGNPYERWKKGVTVMLEKDLGVNLVSKLRAILLMEADFDASNKLVFGNRMLYNIHRHQLMPEEILFYDISRQLRFPAAIASVDASNCFDRICHAIASLVFQASGVPQTAVQAMLEVIEDMKFFLRTSFGDSSNFAGGGE